MMCPRSASPFLQSCFQTDACYTLRAHQHVLTDSQALELLTFTPPVVQAMCSWKTFVAALNSKLFQFWLKFW